MVMSILFKIIIAKSPKMISLSTFRPKFKVGSSKSLNLKKRLFSLVKERPGDQSLHSFCQTYILSLKAGLWPPLLTKQKYLTTSYCLRFMQCSFDAVSRGSVFSIKITLFSLSIIFALKCNSISFLFYSSIIKPRFVYQLKYLL